MFKVRFLASIDCSNVELAFLFVSKKQGLDVSAWRLAFEFAALLDCVMLAARIFFLPPIILEAHFKSIFVDWLHIKAIFLFTA
jgi:hypothetical protein